MQGAQAPAASSGLDALQAGPPVTHQGSATSLPVKHQEASAKHQETSATHQEASNVKHQETRIQHQESSNVKHQEASEVKHQEAVKHPASTIERQVASDRASPPGKHQVRHREASVQRQVSIDRPASTEPAQDEEVGLTTPELFSSSLLLSSLELKDAKVFEL